MACCCKWMVIFNLWVSGFNFFLMFWTPTGSSIRQQVMCELKHKFKTVTEAKDASPECAASLPDVSAKLSVSPALLGKMNTLTHSQILDLIVKRLTTLTRENRFLCYHTIWYHGTLVWAKRGLRCARPTGQVVFLDSVQERYHIKEKNVSSTTPWCDEKAWGQQGELGPEMLSRTGIRQLDQIR